MGLRRCELTSNFRHPRGLPGFMLWEGLKIIDDSKAG